MKYLKFCIITLCVVLGSGYFGVEVLNSKFSEIERKLFTRKDRPKYKNSHFVQKTEIFQLYDRLSRHIYKDPCFMVSDEEYFGDLQRDFEEIVSMIRKCDDINIIKYLDFIKIIEEVFWKMEQKCLEFKNIFKKEKELLMEPLMDKYLFNINERSERENASIEEDNMYDLYYLTTYCCDGFKETFFMYFSDKLAMIWEQDFCGLYSFCCIFQSLMRFRLDIFAQDIKKTFHCNYYKGININNALNEIIAGAHFVDLEDMISTGAAGPEMFYDTVYDCADVK